MKLKIRSRTPLLVLALLALLTLAQDWLAAQLADTYYLNTSASEPLGLYRLEPAGELRRGELVIMVVPPQAEDYVFGRGWLRPGARLLKQVAALPGDGYEVNDGGMWLDGRYFGPVFSRDRQNRPLPDRRGNWRVAEGNFLPLAGGLPNSFDGRYFGDVPQALILGRAMPILTYER